MRTSVEIDLDNLDWEKGGGLIPAIIQNDATGGVLMLGYMSRESFEETLASGFVTFYSRSKKRLWKKGEESGNVLTLVTAVPDCDSDALLIRVDPKGPTCHTGSQSCFKEGGDITGIGPSVLHQLQDIVDERLESGDKSSYTRQLLTSGHARIAQKVGEEAVEVVIAAVEKDQAAFLDETADLLYHLIVLIRSQGLYLRDVERVLDERRSKGNV